MFMFFVPLGFDLCEVGQEEVILKTGKQANRRTMHFALQALLALFGKSSGPAPRAPPGGRCRHKPGDAGEGKVNTLACVC